MQGLWNARVDAQIELSATAKFSQNVDTDHKHQHHKEEIPTLIINIYSFSSIHSTSAIHLHSCVNCCIHRLLVTFGYKIRKRYEYCN